MTATPRPQLYGELYRRAIFRFWEGIVKQRPTLTHLRALEQSQWCSPDEIAALQALELRRLVRHAYAYVPFYRERFDAAGVSPADVVTGADLRKLPLLTRADAREAGDRRRAVAPPLASITKRTSGSTGEPLEFAYDPGSESWRQAIRMRGYGWAGYRQGDRTLHYWSVPPRSRRPPLFWRTVDRAYVAADRTLRREYYVDSTVRSEARMAEAVELIRRKRPSTIVCYAQSGVELARYVVATGARTWPTIPVVCGAEPLLPGDREPLEQAFGAVFDTYGNREVMMMAAECEAHAGLHVQAENVLVELVVREERRGAVRPAAAGELGEVVVTDLHNLGMPFIRYVNGDLAVAGDGAPCPCGRGLPLIGSIAGRSSDTLRDGSGRRVSGIALMTLFVDLASAVRQYQVVQRRDGSLIVRLVPTAALDRSVHERIRRHCDHYLPGVPVTVEAVGEIARSSAGKHRFIVVEGRE